MNKIQIPDLFQMKQNKIKSTFITCYDYSFASCLQDTSIDLILVGDSGGMVNLGYKSTNPVSMEQMIYMAQAVNRGAPNKFIVGDMPKGSYEVSNESAVENAMKFVKDANCDAIKLEGGVKMAERVQAIVRSGIPVMGHIGLLPQSSSLVGGYKVMGRDLKEKEKIFKDAESLVEAGVFAILIEATPEGLAEEFATTFQIPIFGIGAGSGTDGQLLILHDLLGLYPNFRPKFSPCLVSEVIEDFTSSLSKIEDLTTFGRETRRDGIWEISRLVVEKYCELVRNKKFPFESNKYV
jgi:3-methyl-2-oxobutanoate hydroxymethyltransferase